MSNNFLNNIPKVTRHLIIINLIVWVASLFAEHVMSFDLSKFLGLHFVTSPDFNPAQIITYMFMHDTSGISHIFFNMFSLFMFGRLLEQVMGQKKFLFYYMSTGIGAALVQLAVIYFQISDVQSFMNAEQISIVYKQGCDVLSAGMNYTDPQMAVLNATLNGVTVGASGAIFGILLAFGMIFPNLPLYLFFIPIPIKAKYMVIGYGLIELLFGVSGAVSGVAHFAHLGGMIFGLFMILYWRKKGAIGGRYY